MIQHESLAEVCCNTCGDKTCFGLRNAEDARKCAAEAGWAYVRAMRFNDGPCNFCRSGYPGCSCRARAKRVVRCHFDFCATCGIPDKLPDGAWQLDDEIAQLQAQLRKLRGKLREKQAEHCRDTIADQATEDVISMLLERAV